MFIGSYSPGVAGSELILLLASLADEMPPQIARAAFADRLGHWLGWTGAIALSSALAVSATATPPVAATGGPDREEADFVRVRAALAASIAAGPREPASDPADFTPFRRHCHDRQRAMETAVGALRQRLRDALARRAPALARLAAIDAVMDQALAAQERSLLGLVPLRLQSHFERLRRAAQTEREGPDGSGWHTAFRADMARVLQAELAHRLLPARGLLDTLRDHDTT
jgi:hypothetical protein